MGSAPKIGSTPFAAPGQLIIGQVAQLVEHATENRGVGSSILPLATILSKGSPPPLGRALLRSRFTAMETP